MNTEKSISLLYSKNGVCLLKALGFFVSGALLLSAFSIIQKILSGYPLKPQGFIVPVVFGGISGTVAGIEYCRIRFFSKNLILTQKFLESIIDSMPAVLFAVNSSGKITHWNKAAELKTSLSSRDLYKKDITVVLGNIINNPLNIMEIINSGEKKKWTQKIENKETLSSYYYTVEIYPISLSGNGAVIAVTDITEDQNIKNQLEHSRKMDIIGQLAEGVAHDFNNMLGIIIGAAELMQSSEYDLGSDNRKYINMILKSSETAANLASKLMELGRKNEYRFKRLELHDVLNESIDILKRSIDKKISITYDNRSINDSIQGDFPGLQSLFINLGINSSHAMEKGGKISIKTENVYIDEEFCRTNFFDLSPGNYLKLDFTDTGCGMTADIIKKIFEPFFTTKEKGKGNGLGLSAVYETVISHHGFIDVESTPGIGTSFHILLPCS